MEERRGGEGGVLYREGGSGRLAGFCPSHFHSYPGRLSDGLPTPVRSYYAVCERVSLFPPHSMLCISYPNVTERERESERYRERGTEEGRERGSNGEKEIGRGD